MLLIAVKRDSLECSQAATEYCQLHRRVIMLSSEVVLSVTYSFLMWVAEISNIRGKLKEPLLNSDHCGPVVGVHSGGDQNLTLPRVPTACLHVIRVYDLGLLDLTGSKHDS